MEMAMGMEAGDPPGAGEDGGGVDVISDLPDDLLGEIITLLPTKDAVRTQILAPRWRHLWCSAPLNLDCRGLVKRRLQLPGVVSRILTSHPGPGRRFWVDIRDFMRIDATKDELLRMNAAVDQWLRSAALRNLQELGVSLSRHLVYPMASYISRLSTTLRVATIANCNLHDSTVQGLRFPQLKQLALESVRISQCSLHHMIAGCPALECLLISCSYGFRCVRINSLSLTSIGVHVRCIWYKELKLEELVVENAPCLKRLLHLDENDHADHLHISVISAPKLETLRYLSNFTKISFGSAVIQGLCVDSLTAVVRTVKILAVDMHVLSLDAVIQLMGFFPCLEKLYIECSFHSFQSGPTNVWRLLKKQKLIRYLDIPLKTIVLEHYRGTKSQVSFLTFFVLHARLLEVMTLGIRTTDNSEEFLAEQRRKLQLENRVSTDARFYFTTDRYIRNYWYITTSVNWI
ncbi:putative F-box/LRR-repeat protein At3g28410 [Lolium rigidum]|uniref:putative F-box/LRR-repeat protein At3g28410 n=1 Tax=Lolium rigidum TaxID=89674 RepID=UPI001F5DFD78|nr:putative F-box/LRR-repeat protein At3g28410 [Lolium rigidum]